MLVVYVLFYKVSCFVKCKQLSLPHLPNSCPIANYKTLKSREFQSSVFVFLVLTCKVEAVYYATVSDIMGVFATGNSTAVSILTASNAKVNYDKFRERLIYYTSTSGLLSVKLDGSDSQTLGSSEDTNIGQFAINYLTRKIYFVTVSFRDLKSIDIDTKVISAINSSFRASSIKDLDTDTANK